MKTYTTVVLRPEHGRFVLQETGTDGKYKIDFHMRFLKPTASQYFYKIHDINPKLKDIQKSLPLCDIYENTSSAYHADKIYFYDRTSSSETDYEGIVASNPPFGSAYEEYIKFPIHNDGIHRDDVAFNIIETTVKGVGSNVSIEPQTVDAEGMIYHSKDPIKDRTPPFNQFPVVTNDWEVDIPLRWVYGSYGSGKWSFEGYDALHAMIIVLKSKTEVEMLSEGAFELRCTGIQLTWNVQNYLIKSVTFRKYMSSEESVRIVSSSAMR